MQPIRRFGFDAAILFSDILVMPDALGPERQLRGRRGAAARRRSRAPRISRKLREAPDWTRLAPVFEAVAGVRAALPRETALIGFCGAPWTVASYMIAGRGTPDQAPARLFAYRHPETVRRADRPARRRLRRLSRAGRSRRARRRCRCSIPGRACCRRPSSSAGASRRCGGLSRGCARKSPDVPVIAFPRGAATHLGRFAEIEGLAGDRARHRRRSRRSPPRCCRSGWRCKAISIRWR